MGACFRFRLIAPKRGKSIFNFTKYSGNFKQLFPDGGAIAVNRNSREVFFTIKNEPIFQLF